MDRLCVSHDAYSPTESRPQMDPLWPQKERSSERNMEEDDGKRDEGKRLDMGPPGTPSTRPKPVAISATETGCRYSPRSYQLLRLVHT